MINTEFDFRSDSHGKDPDSFSPTLKQYHKLLWSKPLPSGDQFILGDAPDGGYLQFKSPSGVHLLSSDSIANSFSLRKGSISTLICKIEPKILEQFRYVNSTIGSFIIFPSNKINNQHTINVERGFNRCIADRFDLTLECIRRFYLPLESPLSKVLNRYKSFFDLFVDFKGYVNFFLLNDLVDLQTWEIKFFLPVKELFNDSPLPNSEESYMSYYMNSTKFSLARNNRIAQWVSESAKNDKFTWTSTKGLKVFKRIEPGKGKS